MRGTDDQDARGRHQRVQEDLTIGAVFELAFGRAEAVGDVVGQAAVVARVNPAVCRIQAGLHDEALATVTSGNGPVEQFSAAGRAIQPLDEDLHLTPARQARAPRCLVRDAEGEHLGSARFQDVLGLDDHLALDAPSRHRSLKTSVGGDSHLAADRDGRRTPGVDHRRNGHLAIALQPLAGRLQNVDFIAGGLVRAGLCHGGSRCLGVEEPKYSRRRRSATLVGGEASGGRV